MTALATPPATALFNPALSDETRKSLLIGRLGNTNLDILGFVVFWNIREVSVTREQFAAALLAAGLSESYAKEHNARSSLIRALNTFKEQKIVKMVHEDKVYATFQFTAEMKSGTGEEARLNYTPEVIVTVDKEHFTMFKDEDPLAFRNSIKKVDKPEGGQADRAEEIKDQLAVVFESEMNSYRSSDITRYIQKIFTDNADIVSLRKQGSIYFVPAGFSDIVDSVRLLVAAIGGSQSRFDAIPMPDVADARKTIGDSFAEEVAEVLSNLDKEVSDWNASTKDVTEKWVQHRKEVISKIQSRINMYAEVLGEKAGELAGGFDRIAASLKPRVLQLD